MKKLISVFVLAAMLVGLAACKDIGGEKPVSSSVQGGNAIDKTDTVNSKGDETSFSKADEEQKLNLDLLSDLGKTYAEIMKKYGKPTKAFYKNGGPTFVFKGEYGFGFSSYYGYNEIPTDDDGNWILEHVPIPPDSEKSVNIQIEKVERFLLGLKRDTKNSDIEKIYGVKLAESGYDWDIKSYGSSFSFKDRSFYIVTKEEGIITPGSSVIIGIIQ